VYNAQMAGWKMLCHSFDAGLAGYERSHWTLLCPCVDMARGGPKRRFALIRRGQSPDQPQTRPALVTISDTQPHQQKGQPDHLNRG